MLQHPIPGLVQQEGTIGVDTVPRQESDARFGHVGADVGEEVVRRGARAGRGVETGGREPRGGVGADAPGRHGGEDGLRGLDDNGEAVDVEEMELRVGDEAA